MVTKDIFGREAQGVEGPKSVEVTPLPLGGRKVRFRGQATNGLIPNIAPPLWYDFVIIEDASGHTIVEGSSSGFPGLEVCQYGGPKGTVSTYFAPDGPVIPYILTDRKFGAVLR